MTWIRVFSYILKILFDDTVLFLANIARFKGEFDGDVRGVCDIRSERTKMQIRRFRIVSS